ncbi:hypothetical protein ACE1ET_14630 [Saccharicrinis sp. FJH62]|uniref:hypothetical protein n=1 Tax=Saccharicrinis sp. FJH62 TaxID=3344657 RepID=UPI0035D4FD20
MKKYSIISIISIILLISCEKETNIRFGFDSRIDKSSEGLVIANISDGVDHIMLKGVLSLSEGEVEVTLLNSYGDIVYSAIIKAPEQWSVDEDFVARPGYWKLKYKSRNGIGEIDLHLWKY